MTKYRSLLFPIVFILLISCASSSGSIIEEEAGSERPKPEESERPENSAEPGLYIKTKPSFARVLINGEYQGRSPQQLQLPSGNYRILVEKEGFYSNKLLIQHRDDEYREVEIELEEIVGTLLIDVIPSDAEIHLGWKTMKVGKARELRVGKYIADISAFGFESKRLRFEIRENSTTAFTIQLDPAPFRIDDFRSRRSRFHPEDPGNLGMAEFSIWASGPGEAEYTIESSEGKILLGPKAISFTERQSSIFWDGKTERGKSVSDDSCQLVLNYFDEEKRRQEQLSLPIVIDRSISRRQRPLFSSASGSLFCPVPSNLPEGSFQGGFFALAHAEADSVLIPSVASIRYAPADNEELSLSGGIIARSPGSSIPFVSAFWMLPIVSGTYGSSSLIFRASYLHEAAVDPLYAFSGISVALTSQLKLGPVSLALTPELAAGPREDEDILSAWLYGKAALLFDCGPVGAAVSTALKSSSFDQAFSIQDPSSLAVELHWQLPGKPIALSLASSLSWASTGWYISSGGGVWLLQ